MSNPISGLLPIKPPSLPGLPGGGGGGGAGGFDKKPGGI